MPITSRSIMLSISRSGIFSKGPQAQHPTLFMMMQIVARSCSRSDRSAAKDFLSVRSSGMGRMQAGAHSTASFAKRSFLRAMAQISSTLPCSAKALANSAPSPEDAPVTSAISMRRSSLKGMGTCP